MEILVTSLFVLYVYWNTMYHGVPGGDAGELLAEACQLGTAHPPGYPIFIMVYHIVMKYFPDVETSFLQMHTPAEKANAFSCILGAMTCYVISHTTRCYLESPKRENDRMINFAAAFSGASFAFCPLTWEYTAGVEVFSLNNLFVSLLLWCTLRVERARSQTETLVYSFIGAFVCGLSLGNQHTILILEIVLIPFVFFILRTRSHLHLRNDIIMCALAFFLGFCPQHYYLMYSSQKVKAGSWGDMTTILGLIKHVTRSEYGTFGLSSRISEEGFFEHFSAYVIDIWRQFGFWNLALLISGTFQIRKNVLQKMRHKEAEDRFTILNEAHLCEFGLLVLFAWIFYSFVWNAVFSNLPISNMMAAAISSRFHLQPNLLLSIIFGVGLDSIHRKVLCSKVIKQIAIVAIIIHNSRRKLFWHENKGMVLTDYANGVLSTIPQHSLLLSHTDLDWNSIRYLRVCEEMASGIEHISAQLLPFPWFQRQIDAGRYGATTFPKILEGVSTDRTTKDNGILISRFLKANLKSGDFPGGVYVEMQSIDESEIQPRGVYRGLTVVPWGLVYRVFLGTLDEFNYNHVLGAGSNAVEVVRDNFLHHAKALYPHGSWEHGASSIFWDMHYQLGLARLTHALSIQAEQNFINDPESFVRYMKSLDPACFYLTSAFNAVEKADSITSPKEDVLRNSALCFLRLNGAVKVSHKLESALPNLPPYNAQSLANVEENAKNIVGLYLIRTDRTKDPETWNIFYEHYSSLWGITIKTSEEFISESPRHFLNESFSEIALRRKIIK